MKKFLYSLGCLSAVFCIAIIFCIMGCANDSGSNKNVDANGDTYEKILQQLKEKRKEHVQELLSMADTVLNDASEVELSQEEEKNLLAKGDLGKLSQQESGRLFCSALARLITADVMRMKNQLLKAGIDSDPEVLTVLSESLKEKEMKFLDFEVSVNDNPKECDKLFQSTGRLQIQLGMDAFDFKVKVLR